jgi:hypothetical protein
MARVALSALVGLAVMGGAAIAVFQPGYRQRSDCDYMRFEEECRCYASCVYRTVTGSRFYRPPAEARQCPIVRAFPIFEKENQEPRVFTPDPTSKDPCESGSHVETYGDDAKKDR